MNTAVEDAKYHNESLSDDFKQPPMRSLESVFEGCICWPEEKMGNIVQSFEVVLRHPSQAYHTMQKVRDAVPPGVANMLHELDESFAFLSAELKVYSCRCAASEYEITVNVEPETHSAQKYLDSIKSSMSKTAWANLWEASIKCQLLELESENGPGMYVPVLRGSEMWNATVRIFDDGEIFIDKQGSKTRARITEIMSVHNPYLYHRFESHCKSFVYRPGMAGVNERWLFHGTTKNSPDGICLGTAGFDPRVCKPSNLLGRSVHFCTTSTVPAYYYPYKLAGDKAQIILARVACGRTCKVTGFQGTCRPPTVKGRPSGLDLYDSVMCKQTTCATGNKINTYIGIFDSHQAFPELLITFDPINNTRPQT